jgi:hypothetical protein
MRLRSLVVAVAVFCCAPAGAQFFRNNAFTVSGGYQALGTFDAIAGDKLWNINDMANIGAGYTTALGYDFWYDVDVSIGLTTVRISDLDFEPIVALHVFPLGFRYNFMDERFRPFLSASPGTTVIVTGSANIPSNALFGNTPFWAGLRLGGGAEYFIVDDNALFAELQGVIYAGANSPPPGGIPSIVLPSASLRLGWHIYF